MHQLLINYIQEQKLIAQGDKVLLAVSGGIDSVVMCHLFAQTTIAFAIAHCNFNLRGVESDGDEQFVKELAGQLQVPFFSKNCDTKGYAKEKKISIQMAARDLRFTWFEELCEKYEFAVYATAHHIDDAIETYFINQLRGTGIAGLHGLLPKNNKLIHPLLFATREDIVGYVEQNKLSFREDSSNKTIKYLRNGLRHRIMPVIEDLQAQYRSVLIQNMERFSAAESIYLQKIEEERHRICKTDGAFHLISITDLMALANATTYLFEFIKPYGFHFSQAQEIFESIEKGQSGAQFYSSTHLLLRDRENLIIQVILEKSAENVVLDSERGAIYHPLYLSWETLSKFTIEKEENIALLDFDKLQWPLTLRKWKQGDFFFPLGMKGKKLLSDFFIDLKMNQFEKENTWLLLSGTDIVWLIGYRIDHRFRISKETKKALRMEST
ncbi:MAG: tRNA lysidine(34) synthetase TilS [Bacteroidales bacterium]|nr:tRNA lysidine(34) synthetase TilS [Bacteroidales bacterium]